MKLSKEGYGRPNEILEMPADIVLTALDYENFLSDYQAVFVHKNRNTE